MDAAAQERGGGVVVIPRGTFMSGALFSKPKTHLYTEEPNLKAQIILQTIPNSPLAWKTKEFRLFCGAR
ncbi:MAG: hypothetical protein R2822_09260 [Spirosomataceae bacterium]